MLTALRSIDDCAARRIAIVRRVGASAATRNRPASRRHAIARLRRRAVKGLREYGPKATISYALTAAGIRRVGRVVVYAMQREKVLKGGPPIRGVTLQVLGGADVPAYLRLQPHTPEEEVTARMRTGDRCIVAWRDGCPVGARWLSTAIADTPLGVSFPLRPGVAWAYDAFTVPQERRRGIGAMVTAALFDLASASGATHVINGVLAENCSGQGLARGRSKPLGMVGSRRLGPWLIVRSQVPPGYLGAPVPSGSLRLAPGSLAGSPAAA
jgi:acetyltransferase (GNAT) family protein